MTIERAAGSTRIACEIRGLIKRCGRQEVLRDVQLAIKEGECLALFGPSGCGKTTFLRLIAGLDEADAGSIALNGVVASDPVIRLPPNRRRIAMVFQDLALWPHMTALNNVEFAIPRTVKGRKDRRQKAADILNSVHLNGHHGKYPHQMSGGEQQRVAIARALAQDPCILLLDEPFASLDADLKKRMLDLVAEVHAETKLGIVYVTHTACEIPRLAKRVAMMRDGRIAETLSIEAFVECQREAVGCRV
jgi:ABC-type Fe3+/spermidine/putrescine transport system ATPase subunit